jgi:hypothetical protein
VADMFQTVWFIFRGFAIFLLVYIQLRCYRNLNENLNKVSGDKADILKWVWLNVNITTEAPKFTDVSKRHVNKDFYSMQEECHNFSTLQ